jgi:predicted phage terminase large subunit-like protein
MGRTADNRYVILDVNRFQGNAADVERHIYNTAVLDGPDVEIYMEQEPGASGKIMIENYQFRVLAGFWFTGIRSTGPKAVRAAAFSAMSEARNVDLVRGNHLNRWFDELEAFPFGAHDDQVDSAAGAFNQLAGGGEIRVARSSVRDMFSWRSR